MSPVQPQAIKCKSNLLFKLFHFIFVNFVTADTHRGMSEWIFSALAEATRQTATLNRKHAPFGARTPVDGQKWRKLWCISDWVFSSLIQILETFFVGFAECSAIFTSVHKLTELMYDDKHFIIFCSYMQTALHTNDLMNFSSRTNFYSLLALRLLSLLLLCICTETAVEPKLIFPSAIFEWTGGALQPSVETKCKQKH